MQWRDVVIGAVASLVVTVLGGVAVFYATKEPDERKNERLLYTLEQAASFSGDAQNLSFSSLRLTNSGGVAAKRVLVAVTLKNTEFRDFSVSGSLGLRELSREKNPKALKIVYETILPQESVTLGFLLTADEKPNVEIRSESSLGSENIPDIVSSKPKIEKFVEIAVPVLGLLAGFTAVFGFGFLRKLGAFQGKDQNNAGFLLLHQGLTQEANQTLSLAIRAGMFHEYVLSNFALCKAMLNDFDKASRFLAAARVYTRSKHGEAVVSFNEGLINLIAGRIDEAEISLKKAISLSPKPIKKYCRNTVLLESVKNNPKFLSLFD